MRAVLIKGESRYEALTAFLDHLAAALRAREYEVTTIDAARPRLLAA